MRIIFALLALTVLSACATDNCSYKTVNGRCLGNGEFAVIHKDESKLYGLPEVKERVTKVKARNIHNIYEEIIYLNNGIFKLSRSLRGGYYNRFNESEFRKIVSGWTVYGTKVNGGALDIKLENGIRYAEFTRPNKQCLFGQILLGQTRELVHGSGRQAVFNGFTCVPDIYEKEKFLNEFVTSLNKLQLK